MPNPPKSTKVTVEITYEIPDADIEVLLEMAGCGIGYWAQSLAIDSAGRKVTVIDLEEENADGEPVITMASFDDLAQALVNIAVGKWESGYRDYAVAYFAEDYDAGNIDSDLADHVVQYAIFGDVIYG